MIRALNYIFFLTLIIIAVVPSETIAQPLHHTNNGLPCINKNYNLAAHVAVDSSFRQPLYTTGQLDTMITKLNEFFSPICVSFSLCEYNILEKDYSLGIIKNAPISQEQQLQELKTRFTLRRRINIYFLDTISTAICGLSTFEGILTEFDATIYTETECGDMIAGQVAHHLGHTFGLSDTYDANSVELVDGSNCETTGDLICDTPADPFGQSSATPEEEALIQAGKLQNRFNAGCEFIYEVRDPNGEYYQPDMGNIMSSYPCKCGFTQDQYRLMVQTILRSDIRHF